MQKVTPDLRKIVRQKSHIFYEIDEETADINLEIEKLMEIIQNPENKLELMIDGSKLSEMLSDDSRIDEIKEILSFA